jgi:hypothetical protein
MRTALLLGATLTALVSAGPALAEDMPYYLSDDFLVIVTGCNAVQGIDPLHWAEKGQKRDDAKFYACVNRLKNPLEPRSK